VRNSYEYAVRVLAAEGWQEEDDDEPVRFAIREISFEDDEETPVPVLN
jgi:hypothetical protein